MKYFCEFLKKLLDVIEELAPLILLGFMFWVLMNI